MWRALPHDSTFDSLFINKSRNRKRRNYSWKGGKNQRKEIDSWLHFYAIYASHLDRVQNIARNSRHIFRSKVLDYTEMKLKFNESEKISHKITQHHSSPPTTRIIRALGMKCRKEKYCFFQLNSNKFFRVCVLAWASMRFQIDDDDDDDEIFRNIYYVQTLNGWTPIEVLPLRPIVDARFHIHFRRWWSRKSGRREFNAIFVFGCRCCCTHSFGQS